MDASNAVSNKGLSCAPRFPIKENVALIICVLECEAAFALLEVAP
jgi:hypothetical protein